MMKRNFLRASAVVGLTWATVIVLDRMTAYLENFYVDYLVSAKSKFVPYRILDGHRG